MRAVSSFSRDPAVSPERDATFANASVPAIRDMARALFGDAQSGRY
jgi:hypothetical protein